MKTIHLTDDLQQFLSEAVHSGRYSSEDSVIADALVRLREAIGPLETSGDASTLSGAPAKPLTKQEFQRHLVEIGLLDPPVPAPSNAEDPDAALIDDEGEILSEMIIRERLIEWLAGFLDK